MNIDLKANRLLRTVLVTAVLLALLPIAAYAILVAGYYHQFTGETCRVVPLMFHAVVRDRWTGSRYVLRESEFARQLKRLHDAGAVTLPLDSVLVRLRENPPATCPFPARTVIITFDLDGASHQAGVALPHLLENGFSAAFFVPTVAIGHVEGVRPRDLDKLARAGMVLGSHSEYHRDMRSEQPDSMIASLERTRVQLAPYYGQAVTALSAPGGRYNAEVQAGVRAAGFTAFFTSDPCYITPDSDPFGLCRIEVRGDGGMDALQAVDSPFAVAREAAAWRMKRIVEGAVGRAGWRWLHEVGSRLGLTHTYYLPGD